MEAKTEVTVIVKLIDEILQAHNLKIPNYQRPYKWERRHVRNLFYDVREAINKSFLLLLTKLSEYCKRNQKENMVWKKEFM
jgi:uncharacterized protein with ParB-like and HNH nuclease domain